MIFIFQLPSENEPENALKSHSITYLNYVSFYNLFPTCKTFIANLNCISIPTNVFEALSDKNWKQATDRDRGNREEQNVRACFFAKRKEVIFFMSGIIQ